MTSSSSNLAAPPPLPLRSKAVAPRPSLLGAFRGIWLFTWRPQLAWRRLPVHLLGLLVLPALVYLTIPLPAAWFERQGRLINPEQNVNEFARRLVHAGLTLLPEQRKQMVRVFREEASRLEASAGAIQSGERGVASRRQELQACYDRIKARVELILDEKQSSEFRKFERRQVAQGQNLIQPTWGRAEPFYHWLLDFYFFVILPLQCVRASGGLIRDELQADTLGFLLTRPLSRARLLLLKYIAQTAWLELALALETLLLFAAAALRQLPAVGTLLPLFLTAQLVAVPAWSGLGVFLGQLTKRYMPLALVYGFIVEMGIGRIPTNINSLSLIRHLKSLLAHDPGLKAAYDWTAGSVPISMGAPLLAACLFVTLAAFLFTSRECHQTGEMQK